MKVISTLIVLLIFSVFTSDAFATHVSKPIIEMKKVNYEKGETVTIMGWVEYNESPTSNVLLDIIIKSPTNDELVRKSVRSDLNGNFIFNFALPPNVILGDYTVEVISQCRDEHRDICTNQSSSIQFTANKIRNASDGVMVLPTDNKSINVLLTMDRETLEAEKPIIFTLKFLDPLTGKTIQHVNYSYKVINKNGNVVVNKADLHSNEGVDTQIITFRDKGSFTLAIEVAGLGANKPYDTKHSGMAGTTLTVVPEFSVAVLAVWAVVVGVGITITRIRNLMYYE